MLKTLWRLLVILVVIALFTAGIYYLVQSGPLANVGRFGDRGFEGGRPFPGDTGAIQPGQVPARGNFPPEGFRGEREGGGFSLFRGLGGLIGHGLQIALITVLVLFVRNFLSNRRSQAGVPTSGD